LIGIICLPGDGSVDQLAKVGRVARIVIAWWDCVESVLRTAKRKRAAHFYDVLAKPVEALFVGCH
jgi:hypothetical protein